MNYSKDLLQRGNGQEGFLTQVMVSLTRCCCWDRTMNVPTLELILFCRATGKMPILDQQKPKDTGRFYKRLTDHLYLTRQNWNTALSGYRHFR